MFIRALAVMLIVISAIKIISEMAQLIHGCCEPHRIRRPKHWWLYFHYFADLANWVELPLYILTMIFALAQFNSECTCVQSWQWSVGIAALFLAWASLVLFLRKLEVFGKFEFLIIPLANPVNLILLVCRHWSLCVDA